MAQKYDQRLIDYRPPCFPEPAVLIEHVARPGFFELRVYMDLRGIEGSEALADALLQTASEAVEARYRRHIAS